MTGLDPRHYPSAAERLAAAGIPLGAEIRVPATVAGIFGNDSEVELHVPYSKGTLVTYLPVTVARELLQ